MTSPREKKSYNWLKILVSFSSGKSKGRHDTSTGGERMDKQKPQENFFSFFGNGKKNESPKEYIGFHDITRREMERVNTKKINDDTVEVIVTLLKME